VYTKPKGKLPDFNDPVVMQRNKCTVEDFCNKLHKTLIKQFKWVQAGGVLSCVPAPTLPLSSLCLQCYHTHTRAHTHVRTGMRWCGGPAQSTGRSEWGRTTS